jgi:hypothetical protein
MKRFSWLLLLSLAACSDAATGPVRSDSIAIEIDARRAQEAILARGDSLRLDVALSMRGSTGRDVTWRSSEPTVVGVGSVSGGSAVIHGLRGGSSRVVAEAGALADTVLVTVVEGTAGADCSSDHGGLSLEVGGWITVAAAAAPQLCLAAHGAGAEFLLVPFLATTVSRTLQVEIAGEGILAAPTGPSAMRLEHSALPGADGEYATRFDRLLREREARDLTPLVTGTPAERAPRFSVSPAPPPTVGDTLLLNVNAQSSCTSPINRRARVTAVSQRAVVVEDVQNPAGGLTMEEYRSIARDFDELVYPTVTRAFGEPSDIDGNGRVLILFTRAVNELTPPNSESHVNGFFYSRDLFPRTNSGGLRGCAGSNVAEIVYLLAPDPTGEVNGHRRTRQSVFERSPGVIAHELQHLINASRRLRVVGGQNWSEEFWLNEGMSHIAEELTFYAATPLAHRQNINISVIRGTAGVLSRFNQYQASNFARFILYLQRPESASPISGDGLATRGASWSFLRYVADRRGGVEEDLWRKLTDSNLTGYENLSSAIGSNPLAWMHDWAVSLFVDGLVPVQPAFRQLSWDSRSVVPAFTSAGGAYPLRTTELRPGPAGVAHLQLTAGGAGMVRFTAAPGARPVIRTSSGTSAPPPELRLTLVRTR